MKSIINRIHSCSDQWFSKLSYAIAVATILWPAQALATTGVGTLPWDAPARDDSGRLARHCRPCRYNNSRHRLRTYLDL